QAHTPAGTALDLTMTAMTRRGAALHRHSSHLDKVLRQESSQARSWLQNLRLPYEPHWETHFFVWDLGSEIENIPVVECPHFMFEVPNNKLGSHWKRTGGEEKCKFTIRQQAD